MRRVLLLLIFITPALIFSQNSQKIIYTITGKIVDVSNKSPLEDITVVFKNLDSSKIIYGGITNNRGKFTVDVEKGNYIATVGSYPYKAKKLNISTITRDINIGTVAIELNTEYLKEVEVVAEKSTIEYKKNKQVFNVGKDISSNGATVSQVLGNIPSVNVDPSGNIKINGLNNVAVMINGKTSTLSKSDVLKTLPAGTIEKVEVISNPSAKYSATLQGVINIILKKGKDEGLNASLTGTGGYKDYSGGLLTLNNKTKNLNFYTNTQYSHRNPIDVASYENEYFNNNTTTSFLNENSINQRPANTFISTVGMDFYLSKKSTLSTSVNYTNIDAKNYSETYSEIFDANNNLTAINNRKNDGTFTDEIVELVAEFNQKFNKDGESLNLYVSNSFDKENYTNKFSNTNSNFLDEDYKQDNTLKNTNTKVVYTNTISKNTDYEVGYEGNFGDTPFKYIQNNTTQKIDFRDESNAFYGVLGSQLNKFYIQLGLRAEFLKYKINYDYLNTIQNKKFNNLFPDFYIDYSLSDYKSLSFSYTHKYQVPGYYQLQPFEQKLSETISYKGNIDLNPVYSNNFQLTYLYYGKRITLQSTLIYSIYKDYTQYVTYETGEQVNGLNKLLSTPINLGKLNYAAVNITAIYKPSKIVNFTANASISNFDQSGVFQIVNTANKTITQDFNNNSYNANFGLLTKIKIPNWFNFQTNVKHYLLSKGPVSTRQAYTYANMAISKDIFNKNATISITSNDIFNSNRIKRKRFDANYVSNIYLKQKYPTIIASFTYRFNQRKQNRRINFDKKEEETRNKF
ncbi:MAG: outer membrane beta-barrel protein [Lutibacter sp.]|uniref:TonB-dependent receptor domain-containing protein n=1 Tax=Lutibacter sp. TaxID=1925666 RepID=UPI00299EAE7F|nr:TonB-dependent receptor [Lutibacter sp.]MDX1827951.1 outer membrane beta-barrel protein [Lutibacter sp.]